MSERRALLSVSDKRGIAEFAEGLVDRGWTILSTGGTAARLRDAGIAVTDVSEVTGHPEMMEGRVKTLHPALQAGILARRDRDDDRAALEEHGYGTVDLVAVNLYPFRETVARDDVTSAEAMEQVDIGGPTLLRAAGKNHRWVWVVVDPADYLPILEAMDAGDEEAPDEQGFRRALAAKVFQHVSGYDAAIASYLEGEVEDGDGDAPHPDDPTVGEALPTSLALGLRRDRTLRYGENPDQEAALYVEDAGGFGLSALEQLHGKDLSYNNYLDLDGALLALAPFAYSARPAVCIVKHTTPCGLAVGESLEAAYRRALRTDPMSAFGSVIAVNRPVDEATALAMSELFIECIVAPGFSGAAREILTRKKSLRLLLAPGSSERLAAEPDERPWWKEASEELRAAARFLASHGTRPHPRVLRSVSGAMLAQTPPVPPFYGVGDPSWRVVTERDPGDDEWDDLRFAWAAVFGVKSNAIVLAKDGATLGIGAGQMSRVDASVIAVRKAGDADLTGELEGSTLASDAFFPFRDGVDAAAEAGVRAIVQPGGSIRDDEVTAAADEHDIAMVFTGRRLFRH